MKEKIKAFYLRLENQLNALNKLGLPEELEGLITPDHLKAMYQHLQIPEHKATLKKTLYAKEPYRFDKAKTGLARTLNVIINPLNDDIMLILETKSKVVNENGITQKHSIKVSTGTHKSVKLAYRIDTPKPIKMSNAVFYACEKNYVEKDLKDAQVEALIAKKIVQASGGPHAAKLINVTTPGAEIRKEGVRRHTSDQVEEYFYAKQSYYSAYAFDDLYAVLKKPKKYGLTTHIRNRMTENLLRAIKVMHDADSIHQDIKTKNILICEDEKGCHYLTLTDFDITYDPTLTPNTEPLATPTYGSPEIIALYADLRSYHHRDFFLPDLESYGRDIYKKMKKSEQISPKQLIAYAKPNKANDMWSVGIVLHKLYKGKYPNLNSDFSNIPLISGLLNPNRDARLTVDQALSLFYELHPDLKPASKIQLPEPNKNFIPAFTQLPISSSPPPQPSPASSYAEASEDKAREGARRQRQ